MLLLGCAITGVLQWQQVGNWHDSHGPYSINVVCFSSADLPSEIHVIPPDPFVPGDVELACTPYVSIEKISGGGVADISWNYSNENYSFDIVYLNGTWAWLNGTVDLLCDGELISSAGSVDRDVVESGRCREWIWCDPSLSFLRNIADADSVILRMVGSDDSFRGRLSFQSILDLRNLINTYAPNTIYTLPEQEAYNGDSVMAALLLNEPFWQYTDSLVRVEFAERAVGSRSTIENLSGSRSWTIEGGYLVSSTMPNAIIESLPISRAESVRYLIQLTYNLRAVVGDNEPLPATPTTYGVGRQLND